MVLGLHHPWRHLERSSASHLDECLGKSLHFTLKWSLMFVAVFIVLAIVSITVAVGSRCC
ncbi:MAG: hypothetical protein QXN18_07085 [Nitrososphaerota archaeon]